MIRAKLFRADLCVAAALCVLLPQNVVFAEEEQPQLMADTVADYSEELQISDDVPAAPEVPETTVETNAETAAETNAETTAETAAETAAETTAGTEAVTEAVVIEQQLTEASEQQTSAESEETAAEPEENADEDLVPAETEEELEITVELESEFEEETEWVIDEIEFESEFSEYDTNEELVSAQNIVIPPDITLEFRFTQVEKSCAVISNPDGAYVYEEKSEDAPAVGELDYYGLCYILEDAGDGWYYVESMNVRGFLNAQDAVTGAVAQRILDVRGEEEMSTARLLVARSQNSAYTYTHTTVQDVMASKDYAIACGSVNIYELREDDSSVAGTLADGALCYILADCGEDWVFVESGDARGFVPGDCLVTGSSAEDIVASKGEDNLSLASVLIEPEDNVSCYYTLTSVKEASQSSLTREAMVNFALQFVGNPYVWGGTSLTNGADCSGFVQTVYSYFGYSIPRVAADQSAYGMQIPIEYAEPGDLIFYAQNGYVYHVTMYIGNGMVVQAANSRSGIITSGIGSNAVWATRIIED